jgi:hypothetical protein
MKMKSKIKGRNVLPVYPFNTVSQKPHQILMPNMTNGFNFYSKFLLCLPSGDPINKS